MVNLRCRVTVEESLLLNSRKFGISRSLVIRPLPLTACFQYVTRWPLHCIFSCFSRPDGAMQSIATTTDDLENREISAAEIHGLYLKWAYGGWADAGAEAAF
jgi:hypothetical protein